MQKRFAWLAYGLLSGGMVILALESIGIGVDPWVSIAAGFVLGAGKAWAFLLWARLFSWLPLASMLVHSSAACLFAGVLVWLVMGLRAEWVIAVAVAVPFILATAYAYSCSVLSFDSSRKEYDVKFQKVGRLPWRPIIIMALVGFVAALGPIATFGITVTLEEVALLPMGGSHVGLPNLGKSVPLRISAQSRFCCIWRWLSFAARAQRMVYLGWFYRVYVLLGNGTIRLLVSLQ